VPNTCQTRIHRREVGEVVQRLSSWTGVQINAPEIGAAIRPGERKPQYGAEVPQDTTLLVGAQGAFLLVAETLYTYVSKRSWKAALGTAFFHSLGIAGGAALSRLCKPIVQPTRRCLKWSGQDV
jgi:hypothetical protein